MTTSQRLGNHVNLVRWLQLMLVAPRSLREMADKTGMHYETLRPLVKLMHQNRVCHISGWRLDSMGRQSVAVYALGMGADAPRKPPKTTAQRSLKYINRKRQAQEVLKPARTRLVADASLEAAFGMRRTNTQEVSPCV